MELRYHLSRRLVACGTIIVAASLLLVGFQMSLAADDVRDHRAKASTLLREANIDRVTLNEWEPPSTLIAWFSLFGGFALVGTGIRAGLSLTDPTKMGRRDDFD